MRHSRLLCLLFLTSSVITFAQARPDCGIPTTVLKPEHTIFTEQQEDVLGDFIDAQHRREYRVVEGPLNDYLQKIGSRLLAAAPPTKIHVSFLLVESPQINALTFPGGHIYVTTKLITSARSEDEVAAVLGHELGHALMRHPSATSTRLLKVVLGVETLGDSKDIEAKLHQLQENIGRKRNKLDEVYSERETEQENSDALGLYLAARAGYRAEAGAEFWDRVFEVEGKTGNAFTNFFRATPLNQKRLAGFRKTVRQLPASCQIAVAADTAAFKNWQQQVLENKSAVSAPSTLNTAEIKPVALKDPLRPDIERLRYSPNGKYLLSQDEFGVSVFDRDPLKFVFRIDVENASPARFTPDSSAVIFGDEQLRIQRWSVSTRQRESLRDIWNGLCALAEISPTGKYLACVRVDGSFRVLNSETGQVVFQDKNDRSFGWGDYWGLLFGGIATASHVRFNESETFVVYRIGDTHQGVDLTTGKKVGLSGGVDKLAGYSFDFQGNDRFVGVNRFDPTDSAMVSFPAGKRIFKADIEQRVTAATHGDYVIVRPLRDMPVGILSLKENKLVLGNRAPALDVYDEELVSERRNGEIGRYHLAQPKPALISAIDVPSADVTRMQVAVVSSDQKYLAASTRTRGAVWDLATGERLFITRGFDGAYFNGLHFYALLTIPKNDLAKPAADDKKSKDESPGTNRYLTHIDLQARKEVETLELRDRRSDLAGGFLVQFVSPANKVDQYKDLELQVTKLGVGKVWNRFFAKGIPSVYVDPKEDTLIFQWFVVSDGAKAQIKADPRLQRAARVLKDKEGDSMIEIVQLSTGRSLGVVFVESGKGSFYLRDLDASQTHLAVAVSQNRVLLFSIASGEIVGRFFGDAPSFLSRKGLLSVRTDRNKLAFYDLASMKLRFEKKFEHPVVAATLPDGAKELLTLTGDQVVHRVSLDALAEASVATAP